MNSDKKDTQKKISVKTGFPFKKDGLATVRYAAASISKYLTTI